MTPSVFSSISSPASRIDLTRRRVDDVFGKEVAVEIVVGGLEGLQALVRQRLQQARGQLLAGFDDDFAGIGVDQVGERLLRPSAFPAGTECASPCRRAR